jgi:hypothetical protein
MMDYLAIDRIKYRNIHSYYRIKMNRCLMMRKILYLLWLILTVEEIEIDIESGNFSCFHFS